MKHKAVIDLGSLKAKLSIFDSENTNLVHKSGYEILLGKNLSENFNIEENSLVLLDKALKEIEQKINSLAGEIDLVIIATEAIRKARNKNRVQEIISGFFPSVQVQIIDQEKEGELLFKSVAKYFPDEEIAVVDIGGGSVQILQGIYISELQQISIKQKWLLKTGTYYLQQKCSPDNNEVSQDFNKAVSEIKENYADINLRIDKIIFGSTCMLDFVRESKIPHLKENKYEKHPVHTTLQGLKSLLVEARSLAPNNRQHLFPSGGYFVHGIDYLLINLIELAEISKAKTIYPTNLNSSYGLL